MARGLPFGISFGMDDHPAAHEAFLKNVRESKARLERIREMLKEIDLNLKTRSPAKAGDQPFLASLMAKLGGISSPFEHSLFRRSDCSEVLNEPPAIQIISE